MRELAGQTVKRDAAVVIVASCKLPGVPEARFAKYAFPKGYFDIGGQLVKPANTSFNYLLTIVLLCSIKELCHLIAAVGRARSEPGKAG
jgi:hypothetical protein